MIPFPSTATLRVSLTATENGKPKRPHQAFLLLKETQTGLEAPFPLTMRETGKGTVDVVCAVLTAIEQFALHRPAQIIESR